MIANELNAECHGGKLGRVERNVRNRYHKILRAVRKNTHRIKTLEYIIKHQVDHKEEAEQILVAPKHRIKTAENPSTQPAAPHVEVTTTEMVYPIFAVGFIVGHLFAN